MFIRTVMCKRIAGGVLGGLLLVLPVLVLPMALHGAEVVRVRGTILALDGHVLSVRSRDGATVTVTLAEKFAVRAVVKASIDDVSVNTYIGSAALPQPDGRLKALEVLIFPEAARGTAEGHRPWDLLPESTMTNATVAETVKAVEGRVLTLKYKDGEQQLVVPPDAPIVTFLPGDASLLSPGAHVFIIARKGDDGSLQAGAVAVGRDGLVPPM